MDDHLVAMDSDSRQALAAIQPATASSAASSGIDHRAVEALTPIVSALFGASLELASARYLTGDQAERVDDIIDQLDRAIAELRSRVLSSGL